MNRYMYDHPKSKQKCRYVLKINQKRIVQSLLLLSHQYLLKSLSKDSNSVFPPNLNRKNWDPNGSFWARSPNFSPQIQVLRLVDALRKFAVFVFWTPLVIRILFGFGKKFLKINSNFINLILQTIKLEDFVRRPEILSNSRINSIFGVIRTTLIFTSQQLFYIHIKTL